MPNSVSFFIIDEEGGPIYSREKYLQGSGPNMALFSNFIIALDKFVKELGGEETNIIKLGNSQVFASICEITSHKFILRTNRDANPQEMLSILNDIKYLYNLIFAGHYEDPIEDKKELMRQFKQELDKIFKKKKNMDRFLENL